MNVAGYSPEPAARWLQHGCSPGRWPATIWATAGPVALPAVLRTAPFRASARAHWGLTWAFVWQVLDSNQGRRSRRFYWPLPNIFDLRLCSALPNFSGYSPRHPRGRCRPSPWRIRYEHQSLQGRPLTRQADEAASDARADALVPIVITRSRCPVLPSGCPATGRDRRCAVAFCRLWHGAGVPTTQNPGANVAMRAHPSPGAREPIPPTQP
jgi:hypothetical protein